MNVFWKHEVARYKLDEKSSITGSAYSGKEVLNSDGSLLLHNVTGEDARLYTLQTLCKDLKSEEAHVQLQVNIHNLPEYLQAFTWYKSIYRDRYFEIVEDSRVLDTLTWGDHYSRRETVYANGSLMLQDITENDAGLYTLAVLKSDSKVEKAYVQFHVNKKRHTFASLVLTVNCLQHPTIQDFQQKDGPCFCIRSVNLCLFIGFLYLDGYFLIYVGKFFFNRFVEYAFCAFELVFFSFFYPYYSKGDWLLLGLRK
ncbi:hypothetical protein STEG23_037411 [Scotinomys teguina]